jgi:hypothetical protein
MRPPDPPAEARRPWCSPRAALVGLRALLPVARPVARALWCARMPRRAAVCHSVSTCGPGEPTPSRCFRNARLIARPEARARRYGYTTAAIRDFESVQSQLGRPAWTAGICGVCALTARQLDVNAQFRNPEYEPRHRTTRTRLLHDLLGSSSRAILVLRSGLLNRLGMLLSATVVRT